MHELLLLSQINVFRFLVSPLGGGRDPLKLKPATALCHTAEAREMAFLVLLQLAAAGVDSGTSESATPWLVAEQFMLALLQQTDSTSKTPTTPVTPPSETEKLATDHSYDVATVTDASSDRVDVAFNIDIGDWEVRIKDLTQSALGFTGLKNQALTVRRNILCFLNSCHQRWSRCLFAVLHERADSNALFGRKSLRLIAAVFACDRETATPCNQAMRHVCSKRQRKLKSSSRRQRNHNGLV